MLDCVVSFRRMDVKYAVVGLVGFIWLFGREIFFMFVNCVFEVVVIVVVGYFLVISKTIFCNRHKPA